MGDRWGEKMTIRVFGDSGSGNCLKVKWLLRKLGRDFEWVEVDVVSGGSRTPELLALNPAGQVPVVVLEDGRPLAQSNAILLHFAEGTDLVPADAYDRAKVLEWLFWEQYSHEPCIAVRRYQRLYLGRAEADIDPRLMERGLAALARMEAALAASPWLAGQGPTVADLSLVAYTRVADQGGFDLGPLPAVRDWMSRVEQAFAIAPGEGRGDAGGPLG